MLSLLVEQFSLQELDFISQLSAFLFVGNFGFLILLNKGFDFDILDLEQSLEFLDFSLSDIVLMLEVSLEILNLLECESIQ